MSQYAKNPKRRNVRIRAQRHPFSTERGNSLAQSFLALIRSAGLRLVEAMGLTPARTKETDRQQPEMPTLGALFDWYEGAVLQHRSRQAQQAFRATFRLALLRFGREASPTASELQGWLCERVRKGSTASTANALRARLHIVYARARELKWPLLLNAASFPPFQPPQRARRTDPRHMLRSHTATAQQYAARALPPSRGPTKRRTRGRKGTTP